MKIRNGFISNSSSSSFVVFATEKQIDEALKKIDVKYRDLIKNTFVYRPDKIEFEGKEYIRKVGKYNTEDVHSEIDDNYEIFYSLVEHFFENIGPVSCMRSC